jgi:hypothetical protein
VVVSDYEDAEPRSWRNDRHILAAVPFFELPGIFDALRARDSIPRTSYR